MAANATCSRPSRIGFTSIPDALLGAKLTEKAKFRGESFLVNGSLIDHAEALDLEEVGWDIYIGLI